MINSAPPIADIRRTIPANAVIDTLTAGDGWALRRFRRSAAAEMDARGSILFVGGRGDFFEKYLEPLDAWHHSGWDITSVDWRGQGGSGRLAPDPHVGHAEDFGVWLDDLAVTVADWRRRTVGPHVVIGHSMGGHLLVRALAGGRIAPDAAVLVAPMLGFTAPYPDWLGLKVARLMCRLRGAETAAWKVSEKPGSPVRLRQLLLTHDPDRYADELWWHGQKPELQLGPASWGWVRAAYESFIYMATPGVLERVTTPLLVLSTNADALVSAGATRRDLGRLRSATAHEYGREAAHELLREADGVRTDAMQRIAAYLDEKAPQI